MMENEITKAMVLAAGFGTRLIPLTNRTPKPLIEIAGHPIIWYSLRLLAASDIKDITINLHHLGDKVKQGLGDGQQLGVNINYSEETKILGTAGGIKKAIEHFGSEPFVVINGDIISDVKLKDVIASHKKSGAKITMVLRPLGPNDKYTPVRERDGWLVEFGKGTHMYTGMQILDPSVMKDVPEGGYADMVVAVYMPHLTNGGSINAYIHDGFWAEIGTHELLKEVKQTMERQTVPLWYL